MTVPKEGIGEAEVDRLIKAYPRVLRRGVIEALRKVELAIEACSAAGDAFQWLKRYRDRDANRSVVPWYGLYPQLNRYVEKLDDALRALREYKSEDYTPEDARHDIRSQTGKEGGRPKIVKDEAILQWLMKVGYASSKNKVRLQIEADEQIGVKKTRLLQVAKDYGLTKSNRKSQQK